MEKEKLKEFISSHYDEQLEILIKVFNTNEDDFIDSIIDNEEIINNLLINSDIKKIITLIIKYGIFSNKNKSN